MSFADDIKKYAEKTNRSIEKTARTFKMKLFGGVAFDTRVDTGRLRGNWTTSTGAPKFYPTDGLPTKTTKDRKFGEGTPDSVILEEILQNVTAFGVDYMTNNLPYAVVYEEKDGMVSKNIARLDRNLKEAIADAQT